MTDIERKYLATAAADPAEPAAVDNVGRFTCWASTSGNTDLDGDVFIAGAWGLPAPVSVPLLLHHKTDSPVGLITVSEVAYGLRGEGQLNMETQAGRETRALMQQGAIASASVGFSTVKSLRRDGKRLITDAKLREVSLVVFPANPLARVTSIKAAKEAEELKQILDLSREMRDYFRRKAA